MSATPLEYQPRRSIPNLRPFTELGFSSCPFLRLLRERKTKTWTLGDDHAPIADLQAFIEEGIQPIEVFDPWIEFVGGGEMKMNLHREMRCQLEFFASASEQIFRNGVMPPTLGASG